MLPFFIGEYLMASATKVVNVITKYPFTVSIAGESQVMLAESQAEAEAMAERVTQMYAELEEGDDASYEPAPLNFKQ